MTEDAAQMCCLTLQMSLRLEAEESVMQKRRGVSCDCRTIVLPGLWSAGGSSFA